MESEIARLAASGDEFSIAFKVNYISEDLLPVTVTSRYFTLTVTLSVHGNSNICASESSYSFIFMNPARQK